MVDLCYYSNMPRNLPGGRCPPSGRPPSLLALPSYLAGSVARIGHRHLVAVLDRFGLRLPQYAVLAALSDFGALAGHELAMRLQADPSHISAYVEALTRHGWVRRDPDPADRRRHSVALTPSGTQLVADLSKAAVASQQSFLAALSTDEQETLLALLARVVAANDDPTGSAPPVPAAAKEDHR